MAVEAVLSRPEKTAGSPRGWLVGWLVGRDRDISCLFDQQTGFSGRGFMIVTLNVKMADVAPGEDRKAELWLLGWATWTSRIWHLQTLNWHVKSNLISKRIVRERELSKTMRHREPWLQGDIDDKALPVCGRGLNRACGLFATGCNAHIPNGTAKISRVKTTK